MFDIGFSELLVVAVVALIVLGPQRLPHAARLAGLWVRRLRSQWYSVKADLERELAEEEFRRSVGEPIEQLQQRLADEAHALRRQLEDAPAADPASSAPGATDAPAPPAKPDDAAA